MPAWALSVDLGRISDFITTLLSVFIDLGFYQIISQYETIHYYSIVNFMKIKGKKPERPKSGDLFWT